MTVNLVCSFQCPRKPYSHKLTDRTRISVETGGCKGVSHRPAVHNFCVRHEVPLTSVGLVSAQQSSNWSVEISVVCCELCHLLHPSPLPVTAPDLNAPSKLNAQVDPVICLGKITGMDSSNIVKKVERCTKYMENANYTSTVSQSAIVKFIST